MAYLIRYLYFVLSLTIASVSVGTLGFSAESSNLPLPRFVSLRSDEVNLRTGPGVRYPVDWIYTHRDLPVEVIAEFETWRKIRDWQGAEGWVHQSMLSSKRMMVVTGSQRQLRSEADDRAATVALVDVNVVGRLLSCPKQKNFCRVDVESTQGWLRRDEFWGLYPNEAIE